ncbi:CatB-related O-acetyltransferase [Priestia megaterium]|uniref:CatB-related O-acetyltransferase n=1 Tax=Priestia megaterium TaxID=1404 RepID=UPI002B24CD11|nr:CatB-related O-acetyltransferase [Priestia megaterium]MEB2289966.1 CatB-related O-acetyltransferase [Priestia megaterium]
MKNIKRNLRRILFNSLNKDKKIVIKSNVYFNNETYFEGNNIIYSGSQVNNSSIGYGTYLSHNCKFPNSLIGRYCSIGENSRIIFGQHPTQRFVSTHPAFYSIQKQAGFTYSDTNLFEEHKFVDNQKRSVMIGNDVWIGQNVQIMEGVRIADGSVIGTGAIVTKDTEPYSINIGVPSRPLKYRFNEQQRSFLLELKWWDKKEDWILENKKYFEDVDLFYDKFTSFKN